MIKLFKEETESYTPLGGEVSDEFYKHIKIVFDKYCDTCSARDMELIIHGVAGVIASEFVLKRSFKLRQDKIDMATSDPNLPQKVKDLAISYYNELHPRVLVYWGNCKIQAIKACRELTGLDYKESKIWVEQTFSDVF